MRELKNALKLLGTVPKVALWCVGTTWLGILAIWKAGVLITRRQQIAAEVRLCPRGHEVPMYGLWDCSCGNRTEGWVFAPCGVCHESAAYVPCGVCGLPVKNPFLL